MCEYCGCLEHTHSQEETKTHTIDIRQDVLAHEKAHAENLRHRLAEMDSKLINVIGSPGCGKTELIAGLIPALREKNLKTAVIEGDLATDNDARRIREAGAPAFQVMTGTACHLSGHDIEHALASLPGDRRTLFIVENVGNLVCPSLFDLGESLRIVCLSVTEGSDKPQKYPVSFQKADLVVITKHDLIPYVDFDVEECTRMILEIKPGTSHLITSAITGEGIEALVTKISELWE